MSILEHTCLSRVAASLAAESTAASKPNFGCQVTVQSEEEKALLKQARIEVRKTQALPEFETQVWQEFEFDEGPRVVEEKLPDNNPGETVEGDDVKEKESKEEQVAGQGHLGTERHCEYKLGEVVLQDTPLMPMKKESCVLRLAKLTELDEILHHVKEEGAGVKLTDLEEEEWGGLSDQDQELDQGLLLKLGKKKANVREQFAWAIGQQ